jgi:transcriptional regulator of arginine metabolism
MDKQKRQFTIREILSREAIGSQEDLAVALKRTGCEITQATLSRDLAEMGVARIATEAGPRYSAGNSREDHRVRALLSYEVTAIHANESMAVIKTLPGRAQGVAELIDSIGAQEILGTIAGDNTIFVAPRSAKELPKLVKKLRAFITEQGD